ncbi:hypothetical protein DFS33DRAFT_1278159 [Desarmillaria ectypa]|nr:hypothetical protein DFS33DRAFT_1278159 [Desarmillaria ectypa]
MQVKALLPDVGGNIMLGGIVFQLAVITVYVLSAADFLVRYIKDIPIASRTAKSEVDVASMKPVYSRGISSDGWNGVIISTQVYFNVFDGAMVVLAIYTMNFVHPDFLLGSEQAVLSSENSAGSLEFKTEETALAERT